MDEPSLFYKMLRTYPSCVHLQDQPDGNTLLHHAYEEVKIKAAMMLLEYESNPWKENRNATIPLNTIHFTYKNRTENYVRMLKLMCFYDESLVNAEGTWDGAAYTKSVPYTTFLMNQPGSDFQLLAGYKIDNVLKKLLKTKK